MKIIPILQRLERASTKVKFKKKFHKNIFPGDFISIVYYDVEKEQIRLQEFTGICTKFLSKGLNTKISVRNVIGQTKVQQQFFFYSQSVLDVAIVRKRS
jgi:ribosomal protein L19